MKDETRLARKLRTRRGVTTRARLRERGWTDDEIDGLARAGRLRQAGRGVLVCTSSPDTFEQRLAIACALTGGVVLFPTAGLLWAFRGTPRGGPIYIGIPWNRRVRAPTGVVIRRCRSLTAEDIVNRADGIRVTSPPRTVFDAAAFVTSEQLESMIEQGIDRRMFVVVTLARLSGRLYASARRGASTFRRVLASRPAWCKPVRSDLELLLARAMEARGFPRLVREHPLVLGPGDTVHPDLGVPEDKFFVEIDHFTWHGGRRPATYDRRRDMKVRLTGSQVERVTDFAVETDLEATVEDLWALWQMHRGKLSGATPDAFPRCEVAQARLM